MTTETANTSVETVEAKPATEMSIFDFISEFGDGLLEAVSQQNPPVYHWSMENDARNAVMKQLKRQPFEAQKDVVQAVTRLLIDNDEKAAIINADMGTGKTMMAISAAAVMQHEGYKRSLILSPPHLVYKWRREILETIDGAVVWVLNGPDTLAKLIRFKENLNQPSDRPEFFILGRVRMRMGFNWKPAYVIRQHHEMVHVEANNAQSKRQAKTIRYACCPDCYKPILNQDGHLTTVIEADKRMYCTHCKKPLWTLMWQKQNSSVRDRVLTSLTQLPTIGKVRADNLLKTFGESSLLNMLSDNLYEFVNLMDNKGNFVFNDKQAKRIERGLAKAEFSFGQGGYQPSEFIKRHLPDGYFDLMIVDEGHEYKNGSSAQGQAMGVLASKVKKILLLTGTLMGGYADDLFVRREVA